MSSDDDDKNYKKEIPDAAIAKEKAGIQDSDSHALAKSEGKRFADNTYGKEIQDGKEKIQLLNLGLYRWGITIVFVLSCLVVVFILGLAALLLWKYTNFLIEDYEKLGTFLRETWKVLTGASVVVFVQIVVWVGEFK